MQSLHVPESPLSSTFGKERGRRKRLLVDACAEVLEGRVLLTSIVPVTSSGSYQEEASNLTFTPVGSQSAVVVSAYNDYGLGGNQRTGWSLSTDGGSSFTQETTSSVSLNTNIGGQNYGTGGDPVLARDNTSGKVYLATMSYTQSQIDLFTSSYNGSSVNFSSAQKVLGDSSYDPSVSTPDRFDKPWVTVDNWPNVGSNNDQGTIYVAFNLQRNGSLLPTTDVSGMYLLYKRPGDSGWSYEHPNGGSSDGGPLVDPADPAVTHTILGAQVVVGKDHRPILLWWQSNFDLNTSAQTAAIMWSHKQSDGTWTTPGALATLVNTDPVGNIYPQPDGTLSVPSLPKANSDPAIAINPVTGDVYCAWTDIKASGDRGDISFAQLTCTGGTPAYSGEWSTVPSVDGGNANDQWNPAVTVSASGVAVFVGYYSRADDSNNQLIKPYGSVGAIASNHSITWATPQALTSTTGFRQPSVGAKSMGDYDGASADDSNFYYTFTQTGSNGSPQIHMAVMPIPYSNPPTTPIDFKGAWGPANPGPASVSWSGAYVTGDIVDLQYATGTQWIDYGTTTASDHAMTFNPSGLSNDGSYYFRIRAENSAGTFSPGWVCAHLFRDTSEGGPSVTSVAAGTLNDVSVVNVTWDGSPYDTTDHVHLQYTTSGGTVWNDSPANTTTASEGAGMISGLVPDATTLVRVVVEHADGGWSEPTVSFKVGVPIILTGTNDGNGEFEFTWNPTPFMYGDPRYIMHLQYNDGFGWADPEYYTTYADGGWGAISGLNAQQSYSFRIAIVPTSGDEVWSIAASVGGM